MVSGTFIALKFVIQSQGENNEEKTMKRTGIVREKQDCNKERYCIMVYGSEIEICFTLHFAVQLPNRKNIRLEGERIPAHSRVRFLFFLSLHFFLVRPLFDLYR
jgi:hypothetical protein